MECKLYVRPVRTMTDRLGVAAVDHDVYGPPEPGEPKWTDLLDIYPEGTIALLAEDKDRNPVGFLIATVVDRTVDILVVAVKNGRRREGIGSTLLSELIRGKYGGPHQVVETYAAEFALDALNFLKSNGFWAGDILRGYYGSDDAYRMTFDMAYALGGRPAIARTKENAL